MNLLIVGAVVAFIVLLVVKKYASNEVVGSRGPLERQLARYSRRFKKLYESITERNLEEIKKELLQTLEDYANVKREIYTKNALEVKNSMIEMEKSISYLDKAINDVTGLIRQQKSQEQTDSNLKIGANLVLNLKELRTKRDEVSAKKEEMKEIIETIQLKNQLFHSNLSVKRAGILSLMAANLSDDFCQIDVDLDDLTTEFVRKTEEQKIKQDIYKATSSTGSYVDTELRNPENMDELIEEFRNFKG